MEVQKTRKLKSSETVQLYEMKHNIKRQKKNLHHYSNYSILYLKKKQTAKQTILTKQNKQKTQKIKPKQIQKKGEMIKKS